MTRLFDDPVQILLIDDNPPRIEAPTEFRPESAPAPMPQSDERRQPTVTPVPSGEALVAPVQVPTVISEPSPTAQPTEGVGDAGPGRGGSIRDRLAVPVPDARLFAPVTAPMEDAPATVGPAASRSRLAERVRQYNDSLFGEVAAAERATDWTVKGEDGKRWGISPGKIHLGDITLPLPFGFSTPPGRRDDVNARIATWDAIEQQDARARVKDTFEDRVKEIRARKERERAEAKTRPITNENQ